jgi:hypothetical protein
MMVGQKPAPTVGLIVDRGIRLERRNMNLRESMRKLHRLCRPHKNHHVAQTLNHGCIIIV